MRRAATLVIRTLVSALLGAAPWTSAQAQDPAPAPAEPTPAPLPAEVSIDAPPPPVEITPAEPGTLTPMAGSAGEDEYARLRRELPNDFDINYVFVAPTTKRGRQGEQPVDAGVGTTKVSRESARSMRLAGGSLLALGLGTLGVGLGLGLGGVGADSGRTALVTGVPLGSVVTITGATLIGVGRKASRAYGDLPPRSSKAQLTDKQRKANILAASTGWLVGGLLIVAGAVILSKNPSESSTKAAGTFIAIGAIGAGIAAYSTIRLAINKVRRTASLTPAPLFVRGGGGMAVTLRL